MWSRRALQSALIVLSASVASVHSQFRVEAVESFVSAMSSQPATTTNSEFDTGDLIRRRGFKLEFHSAVTEDGHKLSLHRIRGAGPPVLLMHGVLASSDQWLLRGRKQDLAFQLADAGYDVWLGDERGNAHSLSHTNYTDKDFQFWDFSFHDCGKYDLPAMIDKIRNTTGGKKLFYIGHSMGTTVFLVMASMRPEYNQYIRSAVLLAPVAFPPAIIKSKVVKIMLASTKHIVNLLSSNKIYYFLPRSNQTIKMAQTLCHPSRISHKLCLDLLGDIFGENRNNLQKSSIASLFTSFPAGTSSKTMIHFSQMFKTGKFRQFDYGLFSNMERYSRSSPPDYALDKITAPVALIHSLNDALLDTHSVNKLAQALPNVVMRHTVTSPKFTHVDYIFGHNSKVMVNDIVLKFMKKH